jgi:hypothetical protein
MTTKASNSSIGVLWECNKVIDAMRDACGTPISMPMVTDSMSNVWHVCYYELGAYKLGVLPLMNVSKLTGRASSMI